MRSGTASATTTTPWLRAGAFALVLAAFLGCGGGEEPRRQPPPGDPPPEDEPKRDASSMAGRGGARDAAAASPDAAGSSGSDAGSSPDAAGAASLVTNPTGALPMSLGDTGLFPSFPDLSKTHPRALLFEPRYPLYSNGLDKLRHVVLPEGQKVDTSNREAWEFPVGTLFFKTFSFKDPAMGGKERPVETRLIRRIGGTGTRTEQWEFQVYEWSEDGTTATLLNIRTPKDREVVVGGQKITHQIPARLDCRKCHIANFTTIIGFDELRLNGPLGGAAKTQLQEIIDRQWLSMPPPAPHAQIVDSNPRRKWIREYMHANCGHCHNGGTTAEEITRVFDLREKAFVTNTVNRMTEGRTRSGIRILPMKPDESILFLAVSRETSDPELNRMPLVGVQVPDKDAVTKLREWINLGPFLPVQ
jgi:hypothetical protein